MTRIYSGDLLRFGSDVAEKGGRPGATTARCVVARASLLRPDGSEERERPPESRLFRPGVDHDAMDDLRAVTQTLQEALAREKALEEKLIKVGEERLNAKRRES